MWQQIIDQVNGTLESPVTLRHKRPVSGGDIHQAYVVGDEHQQLFIKLNQPERIEQFNAEALALGTLARADAIRIPRVITTGTTRECAFLALEYIPFDKAPPRDEAWYLLGQQLADMHRYSDQPMFGWDDDNFIGLSDQPNQWHRKWAVFFSEQRIGYQLQLAEEKGHHFGDPEQLITLVHSLLLEHHPEPSLLHGDLWQGNVGFSEGAPLLFDPACYFGDRETDIAMTELFNRFPQAFYDGYQDTWPLPDGYPSRREIYNLYHLLNHANLFGGSYVADCQALINRLLR